VANVQTDSHPHVEEITLEGSSVECDEMYYGGKRKNGTGRPMRGDKKKKPVLGMVERDGRVIAKTVPDTTAKTLCGNIREYVMPSSIVYTDELNAYNTVAKGKRYTHRRINHSSKVYVKGDIHTNTIEGFWSLVKRGIGGVYHSVSHKYLQSYLDEYSFRYNRRNVMQPMFISLLEQVSEKA
jgi:transposase